MLKVIPRSFFARSTIEVALSLLGQILVRRYRGQRLSGKIVEVEAYFGENDPASRAYGGKRTKINAPMWGPPGTILVYMVHNNWLLNFVTEKEGMPAAVLIRALEPLEGLELMRVNRRVTELRALTSGPGKLTKALAIERSFNGKLVGVRTGLWLEYGPQENFYIASSKRIGVRQDLPQNLRFYIRGNPFVSR